MNKDKILEILKSKQDMEYPTASECDIVEHLKIRGKILGSTSGIAANDGESNCCGVLAVCTGGKNCADVAIPIEIDEHA